MPTNQDEDFKFKAMMLSETGVIHLDFHRPLTPKELLNVAIAYIQELGEPVTVTPIAEGSGIYELRVLREPKQA